VRNLKAFGKKLLWQEATRTSMENMITGILGEIQD
jgi:hypothetical protein